MLVVVTERRVIKIAVTKAGKQSLTTVADRYGMKEFIVGGRLFEWFARQDDIYQRAVLGLLDGLEVDAARVFMERLADQEGGAGGEYGAKGEKLKKSSQQQGQSASGDSAQPSRDVPPAEEVPDARAKEPKRK